MMHFNVGDRVQSIIAGMSWLQGTVTQVIQQNIDGPILGPYENFSRLPDIYEIKWDSGDVSTGSDWTMELIPPDPNNILKDIVT